MAIFNKKTNVMHYKSSKQQKGQSTIEYLILAVSLVAVWGIVDVSMELLREHHDEYTWSVTQPFF